MTKNKYVIWIGVAIVLFAIGYWAGTAKKAGPGTDPNNLGVVPEEVETTTISEPTSPAPAVSKPAPVLPKAFTIMRGKFSGSGGHTSWGTVTLEWTGSEYALKFGSDFLVTSGPDLYVYMGRANQYEPGFKVGPLQNVTGAQTYSLAASKTDPRYYDEIFIWNEPNSLPFAKAVLTMVK